MDGADPADAAALLAGLKPEVAAAVLAALGPAPAAACAAALPDDTLAAIVSALPLDAAAAAMRRVPADRRASLLERLPEPGRGRLGAMLGFAEGTAGALADPLVLALPDDLTLAEAQRQLRGSDRPLFPYAYVVRRDHTLVGVVALTELIATGARQALASVMRSPVVRVDAQADLATLAAHPAWRDFDALPVVDGAGRLIGAIRHRTIRRMGRESGAPMVATIVGLSELYWAGLAGMIASFAPPPGPPQEERHVT